MKPPIHRSSALIRQARWRTKPRRRSRITPSNASTLCEPKCPASRRRRRSRPRRPCRRAARATGRRRLIPRRHRRPCRLGLRPHLSSRPAARATRRQSRLIQALGQLSLKPGSVVIRHASDGDWAECTDLSTGKRGKVPASAIQEVKETSAAAPTTAPEKKKGYTYSSLPSLTGGPKRKIFKQPKRR